MLDIDGARKPHSVMLHLLGATSVIFHSHLSGFGVLYVHCRAYDDAREGLSTECAHRVMIHMDERDESLPDITHHR